MENMPKSTYKNSNRRRERIERARHPLLFAKLKGEKPKLRIAHGAWINALESPPFGSGKFTWQLTITFPCKLPKDERMERFKEKIQDAFEEIYL